MNKENLLSKEELRLYLYKAQEEFRAVECGQFFSEMEKGRIIHEARQKMGKGRRAKGEWGHWIENDLGISKRTGQNYRDLFVNFSSESPDRLAAFSDNYLQEVGVSRLVNFLALYKKVTRKKYCGGVKVTCNKDQISITSTVAGGQTTTRNLNTFTVLELKNLIPRNAKHLPPTVDEALKNIEAQILTETNPVILQTLGREAIKLAFRYADKTLKLQKQLEAVTVAKVSKTDSKDKPPVDSAAMPDPQVVEKAA